MLAQLFCKQAWEACAKGVVGVGAFHCSLGCKQVATLVSGVQNWNDVSQIWYNNDKLLSGEIFCLTVRFPCWCLGNVWRVRWHPTEKRSILAQKKAFMTIALPFRIVLFWEQNWPWGYNWLNPIQCIGPSWISMPSCKPQPHQLIKNMKEMKVLDFFSYEINIWAFEVNSSELSEEWVNAWSLTSYLANFSATWRRRDDLQNHFTGMG